jgi:V8-like Glu-specific endopeptidase
VRRSAVVLATVLLVLAGALSAAGADAADPAATRHGHATRVLRSPSMVTAGRARVVRDYWTPARMAAATPVDVLLGMTSPDRGAAVPERPRVHVPTTVGKLFFTTSAGDASCTASAIRTRKRNQVITAGHCVNTGPDGGGLLGNPEWYSNWVFVPRYHNGEHPFGTWVATNAFAFDGWIEHGRYSRDQAIIKLQRRHGHKLTQVVGANRIRTGLGQRQRGVRIWGWPAEYQYDGERAVHCDGRTTRRGLTKDAKMRCPMNGGASGGPWLLRRDRHPDWGLIWAVTSRRTLHHRPKLLLAVPLPNALHSMLRKINGA